jgi:WD40 repeat protein
MVIIRLLPLLAGLVAFGGGALAADAPVADPAQLRIESGDHTGVILGLAASADGTLIATGAYDGTVRTWSVPELKPVGKPIHLPVGDGIQGAVYSVALSPDAKTVVATGWTGSWTTGMDGPWCFYVIDLVEREIRRTVCDLPQRANHVAFSLDGKYLAFSLKAGSFAYNEGGGVRVYRTSDYSMVGTDTVYANSSNWVEFDRNGRMLTSSMDGKIRIYDKNLEKGAQLRPTLSKAMPDGRHVDGLAVSPDGSKIAVGYFESEGDDPLWPPAVDIVSAADLSFLPRPDLHGVDNGVLWRPAWSADGAYLYAAGSWKKGNRYMIRRWADGGAGKPFDFAVGSSKIMRMRTVPKGQVVFATEVPALGLIGPNDKVEAERPPTVADFNDIGDGLAIRLYGRVHLGRQVRAYLVAETGSRERQGAGCRRDDPRRHRRPQARRARLGRRL